MIGIVGPRRGAAPRKCCGRGWGGTREAAAVRARPRGGLGPGRPVGGDERWGERAERVSAAAPELGESPAVRVASVAGARGRTGGPSSGRGKRAAGAGGPATPPA